MRLAKYLAHAGAASRRRAEALIIGGAVAVNDLIVREVTTNVVAGDRVELSGSRLTLPREKRYLVLHKPLGVMTTMRDPQGRRTVASLVPREPGRVVPVGRLDYQTAGVLLLTDDGDLAHVLTHPRYGVEKTYRAVVRGRLSSRDVSHLMAGVHLDDGTAATAKVRVIRSGAATSEVDVTIHEGRNRQVRRMFEATAHPVVSLTRLRFGPLALGDLPPGRWREATQRERIALRSVLHDAREHR